MDHPGSCHPDLPCQGRSFHISQPALKQQSCPCKQLNNSGVRAKEKSPKMRSVGQKILMMTHDTTNHMTERARNRKHKGRPRSFSALLFFRSCLFVMVESCLYSIYCTCVCMSVCAVQLTNREVTASGPSP